ncbi:MAG: endonuclease/exonuclease/phosphatase family protein [Bacteroidaceae bacterium]|nr:endonuclease/exonuclease/phosphatase family protein [Bacteroidaceae bacterium]
MKGLGKFLSFIVWMVTLLMSLLLLFSAFSPSFIQPVENPLLSLAGFAFPFLVTINFLFFLIFLLFRKIKFAILPLLGIVLCYSQLFAYFPFNLSRADKPENSLKILSYNTMNFGNMEKKKGVNDILEYLKESKADIICLQEHTISGSKKFVTQEDVDKALSEYPYRAGKTPKGQHPLKSIAVYSKLPLLKTERVAMQNSTNGAMAYQLKWGEDTLLLINCHLESNKLTSADKEMYEQMIEKHEKEQVKTGAKVLLKKLAEASAIRAPQADSLVNYLHHHPFKYIMVCGDFNDTPISYTHHVLTRLLNDAFAESGRGLGISYHKNKFLFRIDNILVSPDLNAKNCTVDSSIDASDHYPIWAYVEKN